MIKIFVKCTYGDVTLFGILIFFSGSILRVSTAKEKQDMILKTYIILYCKITLCNKYWPSCYGAI